MADVILIGASVRALADSARRAGYPPLCVDLFRDADLLSHHPDAILCPLDEYPWGFVRILETLPPLPVAYTGGLENHSNVIRQISQRHYILGNSDKILRRVRNPFLVQELLAKEGCKLPEISRRVPDDTDGWVKKRFASSAGRGISHAVGSDTTDATHFYQRFVPGLPYSASFIGMGDQAFLVGVSEQLIGCDWLNAKPFWYCGNIGPLAMSPDLLGQIKHNGNTLSQLFWLSDCFGIDLIVSNGQVYLIEINPRYTASNELYERYWNYPLSFSMNIGLFKNGYKPQPKLAVRTSESLVNCSWAIRSDECMGKAIWHTPHPCRAMYHPQELPPDTFADLPHHGQEFGAHEPFVTIFAKALDRGGVLKKLQLQAERIPGLFKLEPR